VLLGTCKVAFHAPEGLKLGSKHITSMISCPVGAILYAFETKGFLIPG